jgi:hypothetical protein
VAADAGDEGDLVAVEVRFAVVADERDAPPAGRAAAEHGAQLGPEAEGAVDLAVAGAAFRLAVRGLVQRGDRARPAREFAELGDGDSSSSLLTKRQRTAASRPGSGSSIPKPVNSSVSGSVGFQHPAS